MYFIDRPPPLEYKSAQIRKDFREKISGSDARRGVVAVCVAKVFWSRNWFRDQNWQLFGDSEQLKRKARRVMNHGRAARWLWST
jgi:hypothetical protein